MKKKLILSLGGFASLAMPVTFIVACNEKDGSEVNDKGVVTNEIKVGTQFNFTASTDEEAKAQFNEKFATFIKNAANAVKAGVDQGKLTTKPTDTAVAVANPEALINKEQLLKLNGFKVVGIYKKGNNVLLLLGKDNVKKVEKAPAGKDIQLTYRTDQHRNEDNNHASAKAGMMADFGSENDIVELHQALSADNVTAVIGFYHFAQQEVDGGPYMQKIYFLREVFTAVNGAQKTVSGASSDTANFDNIEIKAKVEAKVEEATTTTTKAA